jgi:hypothetical protein
MKTAPIAAIANQPRSDAHAWRRALLAMFSRSRAGNV